MVAGRKLPITRLAFREGKLEITASVRTGTDWAPLHDVPAAVFGPDGRGVCQGWRLSVPWVRAGEHVTIILPIRIDSLNP